MGFDTNGNWTSDFFPITDKEEHIPISSAKFQQLIQTDIKSGFDNCLTRDGAGKPSANLNFNGYKITNLADGNTANDAVNKGQLDNAISTNVANRDLSNLTTAGEKKFVPVGCLQFAPLSSLEGYLLCDGQAVSRETYADLFAAIGVNFGVGDGVNTFNLPDYRGCFLRGFGGDSALDMYTKQAQGAPNITGTLGPSRSLHTENGTDVPTTPPFTKEAISGTTVIGTSGDNSKVYRYGINLSTANSIYGAANEIRPVNFAVNIFIKY